jgi:hypothetical protein
MKHRWLARIMGGVSALILSAAMVWAPVHSGILKQNTHSVLASDNCDCSKCSSDQVCCPTKSGYCGCFPQGVSCLQE